MRKVIVSHTLEVGHVRLLVEAGALEAERVNNVVDLNLSVVDIIGSLLSRSIGTGIYNISY